MTTFPCDVCRAALADFMESGLRWCADCWAETHEHVERGAE